MRFVLLLEGLAFRIRALFTDGTVSVTCVAFARRQSGVLHLLRREERVVMFVVSKTPRDCASVGTVAVPVLVCFRFLVGLVEFSVP